MEAPYMDGGPSQMAAGSLQPGVLAAGPSHARCQSEIVGAADTGSETEYHEQQICTGRGWPLKPTEALR